MKVGEHPVNEIINITNHINIVSIVEELNKYDNTVSQKDPYMHFYETFLYKYNPELRELRGVYYTPQSVVNFIIDSIDTVLKEYFNKNKGLGVKASAGIRDKQKALAMIEAGADRLGTSSGVAIVS